MKWLDIKKLSLRVCLLPCCAMVRCHGKPRHSPHRHRICRQHRQCAKPHTLWAAHRQVCAALEQTYPKPLHPAIRWQHRSDKRRHRLALWKKCALGNWFAGGLLTQIPQSFGTRHIHREGALHTLALPCAPAVDHRTAHSWRIFQHHFGRGLLATSAIALSEEVLRNAHQTAFQHILRAAIALQYSEQQTHHAPSHFALLRNLYLRHLPYLKNHQQKLPLEQNPLPRHRHQMG